MAELEIRNEKNWFCKRITCTTRIITTTTKNQQKNQPKKKLKNGEKNLITIIDVESIGQAQHQQLYTRNHRTPKKPTTTTNLRITTGLESNIYYIYGFMHVCVCAEICMNRFKDTNRLGKMVSVLRREQNIH